MSTSAPAKPFLTAIWIGVVAQLAGRVLDGFWHANHVEFEAASQQLEAHWLAWLGILITLVATVLAFVRLAPAQRNAGYSVILAGGAIYVPVAVWHFIEHANYNDPELAHYLLVVGQVAILAGAVIATLLHRRAIRT